MKKARSTSRPKSKAKPFRLKTDHVYSSPTSQRKLPASVGLVLDVRNELNSRFDRVDARFDEVDARFDQIDARFGQMEAKFEQLKEDVRMSAHRIEALFVEQRSENRIVLEGLMASNQQIASLRSRVDQAESFTGPKHHKPMIEK